jgi:hypothetical protein
MPSNIKNMFGKITTTDNIGYIAQTGIYDWWALVAMTVVGHRNLEFKRKDH